MRKLTFPDSGAHSWRTAFMEPGAPSASACASGPLWVLEAAAVLIVAISTGEMLAGAHQWTQAIIAVLSILVGGTALLCRNPGVVQAVGYLLGLGGISLAVIFVRTGFLEYVPWTILGAVAFPEWMPFLGLGAAGVASYLGALWIGDRSMFEPFTVVAAATIGVVHLGALVLVREARTLARLALTDPLTGLANRRLLTWRLHGELARVRQGGETLSLLFLDLDGFKLVNDIFGHHAGDRVLRQVADVFRKGVRPHDVVARVGGDEFVILASGLGDGEAAQAVACLQTALAHASLPLPMTVTAGWVTAPRDGTTQETLLDLADAGLFEHKRHVRSAGHALAAELVAMLRALPEGAQRLVRLLDAEEVELEEHLARVGQWSLLLAQQCTLPPDRQEHLLQAALLHDVGKLALPQALLTKSGLLSSEERVLLTTHVTRGVALLQALGVNETVTTILAAHHERWDGMGYPAGLAGEAIPLEARILALADSYDAMTSVRPYRQARTTAEALTELQREAGRQFDPNLVNCLILILTMAGSSSGAPVTSGGARLVALEPQAASSRRP